MWWEEHEWDLGALKAKRNFRFDLYLKPISWHKGIHCILDYLRGNEI